jgi:putative Mn2+ efflux pump MntP
VKLDVAPVAKTFVLVLSLGLDTFAVAVGLGISGLPQRDRIRFGLSFALAEGIMPLIGFFVGQVIASALGNLASYLAIALLLAVGIYTLWEALHEEDEREYAAASLPRLLALALSVSLDELAVGFSLGLLHIPIALAVVLIALQALILTYIGTAVGRYIGETVAERAEMLSGIVLTLLAVFLLGEKLIGG